MPDDAPPPYRWSPTPPDRPGWWWVRMRTTYGGGWLPPDAVRVAYTWPGAPMAYRLDGVYYQIDVGLEWSGPIPEPVEDARDE